MIVTKHEMEIIELLQDEINGILPKIDIMRNIAHSYYYTNELIMSLKLKGIVYNMKYTIDGYPRMYVMLEEEYKRSEEK